MRKIAGVRFRKSGKIQYCGSNVKIEKGDFVVVQTEKGLEFGKVESVETPAREKIAIVNKILRTATKADTIQHKKNKEKEKLAFATCKEKVRQHNLEMKLLEAECMFDASKILFYFTSDHRVDFRKLVKELAAVFRTRIEMRQVGVRDEAKILNSVGMCGRGLCCSTFLDTFWPVSIKMAKDQGLSLSPTKISGVCGRLMCCLKYEEEQYEELSKGLPREGSLIKTVDGMAEVISVSVLKQMVKAQIRSKGNEPNVVNFYNISEITVMKRKNKNEKAEIPVDEELKKLIED